MEESLNTFNEMLNNFVPTGKKEEQDYQKLLEFFRANQLKAFNNDNFNDGHITGSAFVYDPSKKKLLLLHHKKLNRWLQPGGHSDGNPNIIETAKREVYEETGLTNLECNNKIFDIDIHVFPAKEGRNPEHFHYDVRFLFVADSSIEIIKNIEESNEIKWISIADVWNYLNNGEEAFRRVIEKLNQL